MGIVEEAIAKFEGRSARVAVLGLGYAGLPLACTFAEAGFATVGLDIDQSKIDALRVGRSYIEHIASERLRKLTTTDKLHATTDFAELKDCDAVIICVPTPLGEGRLPDLTAVTNTAKAAAPYVHRGQLVALESTTYPGTTDEVLLPILTAGGLEVGTDFFLAFSPEREDPANIKFSTKSIPKVVGGVTKNCLKVAAAAYGAVVDRVVEVSSARVAESTKLLENIYRCVNIAMVNELKMLFDRMDIDVWEVINAAATKPFGFTPFYPGPGLGGHCIPIDPFYLSWKARHYDFSTRFIELAGEINTAMPEYVVNRLIAALNRQGKPLRGAKILLIGVAYKSDVDDVRESPAFSVMKLLGQGCASVSYHDPHVPVLRSRHIEGVLSSVALTPDTLRAADAVVIITNHRAVDYKLILDHTQLVIDTRNATAPFRTTEHMVVKA